MNPESFWKTKPLHAMTSQEWESLCDGCAQCCLNKLEDVDTGEIYFTRVACQFVENESCRCSHYPQRRNVAPDCLQITPKLAKEVPWLPKTCAYKLLANGDDLPPWHPLVSGNPDSTHKAGASIRGKFIYETQIGEDEFIDYIIYEDDMIIVSND